jgi:hypothetical protein
MAGIFGVILAVVPVTAQPVAAQDSPAPVEEGPWRLVLKAQLKQEKGCDLNEVLTYQEIPLGDDVAVQGKVSCIDNREFDFSRNRKHQKFRIELCEPTVC